MQASYTFPFAAGVILLTAVTLSTANPKRNKPSKVSGAGYGGSSTSGAGVRQINHNRAMSFSSLEFGGSLSSSARRLPTSHSYSHGSGTSRHTRTQSLNRNVPHTLSATTSMGDIRHSRNPSSGGGVARSQGTGGHQGGFGDSKRGMVTTRRTKYLGELFGLICPFCVNSTTKARPLPITINSRLYSKSARSEPEFYRCTETGISQCDRISWERGFEVGE